MAQKRHEKKNKMVVVINAKLLKLFPHPPYSPVLDPSDYFLFADVKRVPRERDNFTRKVLKC